MKGIFSRFAALGFLAAAAIALGIVSGCTTLKRSPAEKDPMVWLAPGATVYARFSKAAIADLAPEILPGDRNASLAPLVRRTTAIAIGTSPAGPGASRYDFALVGDYSKSTVNLALAVNPEWRKDGASFTHDPTGIHVGSPADGVVIAAGLSRTPVVEPSPGDEVLALPIVALPVFPVAEFNGKIRFPAKTAISPLPARFAGVPPGDIFVWIPDPFTAFASALPVERVDLPIAGICVRGTRILTGSGAQSIPLYSTTFSFVMKDEEAARTYRPALRFAWFALSRNFLVDASNSANAVYALDKDSYTISGLMIPASTFGVLFRMAAGEIDLLR